MTTSSPSLQGKASLKETLERIHPICAKYQALIFQISKLMIHNRHPSQVEAIYREIKRIFIGGEFFRLANDDIVLLMENSSPLALERTIAQFKRTLPSDPLVSDIHKRDSFILSFELGIQWRAFCLHLTHTQQPQLFRQSIRTGEGNSFFFQNGLTPEKLLRLESVLTQSDLTSFIRRQKLFSYDGKGTLTPLSLDAFFSLSDLQASLKLHESITDNVWLFRQFTMILDKQMIKNLEKILGQKSDTSLSITLSLKSLITHTFQDFVRKYSSETPIIIFFDFLDALAHLEVLEGVKEILQPAKIQYGFTNISLGQLPILRLDNIQGSFYKLNSYKNLENYKNEIKHLIQEVGAQRIIMQRCNNNELLEAALSMGLQLFQGHAVDNKYKLQTPN